MIFEIKHIIDLPQSEIASLQDNLSDFGEIKFTHYKPGPQNSLDNYLPSVISVIISGVFAGVFNEAGSDIYDNIKKHMNKLYEIGRNSDYTWRTVNSNRQEPHLYSIDEFDKESSNNCKKSPAFEIKIETNSAGKFRFVFPNDMEDDGFESSIFAMIQKTKKIIDFCEDQNNQNRAILNDPKKFFGEMPENLIEMSIMRKNQNIIEFLPKSYIYCSKNNLWVGIL